MILKKKYSIEISLYKTQVYKNSSIRARIHFKYFIFVQENIKRKKHKFLESITAEAILHLS